MRYLFLFTTLLANLSFPPTLHATCQKFFGASVVDHMKGQGSLSKKEAEDLLEEYFVFLNSPGETNLNVNLLKKKFLSSGYSFEKSSINFGNLPAFSDLSETAHSLAIRSGLIHEASHWHLHNLFTKIYKFENLNIKDSEILPKDGNYSPRLFIYFNLHELFADFSSNVFYNNPRISTYLANFIQESNIDSASIEVIKLRSFSQRWTKKKEAFLNDFFAENPILSTPYGFILGTYAFSSSIRTKLWNFASKHLDFTDYSQRQIAVGALAQSIVLVYESTDFGYAVENRKDFNDFLLETYKTQLIGLLK